MARRPMPALMPIALPPHMPMSKPMPVQPTRLAAPPKTPLKPMPPPRAPRPPSSTSLSPPPYIASGDRHLSEGDLRFEPSGALTDHADGLSALRIIVAGAARHLAPQGWLLMEHGYDQAAAVRTLLSTQGYTHVQSWRDLASIERVTGAQAH